jgi:predicted nucleic-acid-binding protein
VRAVDTNVIVRFLTGDDARQAAAARRLFEEGDLFVSVTVLLETEWVLRAGYGFDARNIASGIAGLAGLPGVSLEDPAAVARALEWLEKGMDFADALHLSRSASCVAFVTFDRKLATSARKVDAVPVHLP